jgi:DNA-binding CsgD family transcriptional regulator
MTAPIRHAPLSLVSPPRSGPLSRSGLSPRERQVLALIAAGRTNAAIGAALVISIGAVEKHVANIFIKLRLPATASDHRRVLAALWYVATTGGPPVAGADPLDRTLDPAC